MTKKAKATFTVGQTIQVWKSRGMVGRENERVLKEYEVTSVNGTSVYAKNSEFPDHSPTRFNKKTLKSEASMAFGRYHIILDPDAFYEEWDRKERVKELKVKVTEDVKNIHDEKTLQEILMLIAKSTKK